MYGANTRNKLTMLEKAETVEEANAISDEILRYNDTYFAPYLMKAKYAYGQGDFGQVIQYFNRAIAQNPFDNSLYEEYGQYLAVGIELYRQHGDASSAEACARELLAMAEKLEANKSRLSQLGKRINDQPITELSDGLQEIVDSLKGANADE